MPYVEKEVEVWVDLDDFEDDELYEEIKRRGMHVYGAHGSVSQVIKTMYDYEQMGKDITPLIRELYYTALGKVA